MPRASPYTGPVKKLPRMLLLLGLGLLAACTTPPVTIGLSNVTLDLTVAMDSAGKVLFPESPVAFENPLPGVSVASVTIRGQARLAQSAQLSFDVYAADASPADLGCTKVGTIATGYFYACDPGTPGVDKVSQETLAFHNTAGPVPLTLSGEVLARGINRRSLYLGAVVSGGTAGNKLYLERLSATIQLNVGK